MLPRRKLLPSGLSPKTSGTRQASEQKPRDGIFWRALFLRSGGLTRQNRVRGRLCRFRRRCTNLQLRMESAILAARVEGLTSAPTSNLAARTASTQLASLISEARKAGYVGEELDARLAVAEIEMKSGATASARSHLIALEKDARAKGFGLVAQKAAALHSSS